MYKTSSKARFKLDGVLLNIWLIGSISEKIKISRFTRYFSLMFASGITVLDAVLRKVLHSLGPGFRVEIHETHHKDKKDAPSGTALQLGETIASIRGGDPASLGYQSERRGEIAGEHTVIFTSPNERLEFKHSVGTRDIFAEGALVAARWLNGRPPGRYSMQDVLFND